MRRPAGRRIAATVPRADSTWTPPERSVLRTLRRPEAVQRFVDELPYNKEAAGETCRSPRRVLRDRTAQCFEAAVFAAAALRFHGHRPLVLLLAAENPGLIRTCAASRAGHVL